MRRSAAMARYVYDFDEPSDGGRELLGGKGIGLAEIRDERARWMRGSHKYASLVEIYDELEYAEAIHRRLGCPVIEVSDLAIEETAQRIIRIVESRVLESGQRRAKAT